MWFHGQLKLIRKLIYLRWNYFDYVTALKWVSTCCAGAVITFALYPKVNKLDCVYGLKLNAERVIIHFWAFSSPQRLRGHFLLNANIVFENFQHFYSIHILQFWIRTAVFISFPLNKSLGLIEKTRGEIQLTRVLALFLALWHGAEVVCIAEATTIKEELACLTLGVEEVAWCKPSTGTRGVR